MTLSELFQTVPGANIRGNGKTLVRGIAIDSRSVSRGDLFVALQGATSDGRAFIGDAIAKGASAIAAETEVESQKIPFVQAPELRSNLGVLSSRVYGEPSRELTVVGVTGTNGKTTVCHLVESIFRAAGKKPGILGTVAYRWNGREKEAPRTTPEATELHRMLRDMCNDGVDAVVMECSSHGLEMRRLSGLELDVAVFTNLTPEHLDFHSTMEEYGAAKKKIFDDLLAKSRKVKRFGVLNVDDPTGAKWSKELTLPIITFSVMGAEADVVVTKKELRPDGIQATFLYKEETFSIHSPLVGTHNLSNIATAAAVGLALDYSKERIIQGIESLSGVPGRLERVPNSEGINVFVDYAHTDDALENVLKALEPLRQKRLIVLFGCGGDRDRSKRPRMARVAASAGDITVITSDNPRTESPDAIVDEIVKGLPPSVPLVEWTDVATAKGKMALREVDRRKAIALALSLAKRGDILLIAGKGHETYQEINGVKMPFDDRKVARE